MKGMNKKKTAKKQKKGPPVLPPAGPGMPGFMQMSGGMLPMKPKKGKK